MFSYNLCSMKIEIHALDNSDIVPHSFHRLLKERLGSKVLQIFIYLYLCKDK